MSSTISFGSDIVVNENAGVAWLELKRTGNLSTAVSVLIFEDWANSTAQANDIMFNPNTAGSNITYMGDSKSMIVYFAPGVSSVYVPYSISNDIVEEPTERLYFKIVGVGTGNSTGKSSLYIQINDNDAPITLNVSDAGTVNEGQNAVFTVSLNKASTMQVNFRASTLYDTASSTAGDYEGVVDKWYTIPAGSTSVSVVVKTYTDSVANEGTERFRLLVDQLSTSENVVIGKSTGNAYINDMTVATPPELSISNAGNVSEGDWAIFQVSLNKPATTKVVFTFSTYYSVYNEANAGGEQSDYQGVISGTAVIEAGQYETLIPIKTFQDNVYNEGSERFVVKIDNITQGNAVIKNSSGFATIIDTTPVPVPDAPTPITTSDLNAHAQLFQNLESKMGTSMAASIIGANKDLSDVGKTLDLFGLLSSSLKSVISWFVGSTAYASTENLFTPTDAQNSINMGLRLQSPWNPDEVVANIPVRWTYDQVEETQWLGLRAGDYVDGRLVIHQPWVAFDHAGNYTESNSVQGRNGGHGPSHAGDFSNSIDMSRISKYVITPTDVYVEKVWDEAGSGYYSNSGLGNVVTLKAVQKTFDNKDIYITFAHLKQGTVNKSLSVSDVIKAGTIIGEVGDTGGDDYPVHLHMQVGTKLTESSGHADASVVVTPPVYMLGFTNENVSTISELNDIDPAGKFAVQDYGFPVGDTRYVNYLPAEPLVAFNIRPTISQNDFNANNDFIVLDPEAVIINYGDNGVFARFKVRLYDDVKLTEEISLDSPVANIVKWTTSNLKFTTIVGNSAGNGADYVGGINTRGENFGDPLYFDISTGQVFVKLLNYEQNWANHPNKYMGLVIESASGVLVQQKGSDFARALSVSEPYGTGGGTYPDYPLPDTEDGDGNTGGGGGGGYQPPPTNPAVINGTNGDDVFVATVGNQNIYGGDGFDELQFIGPDSKLDNFTTSLSPDGGIVINSNAFGLKTVHGVEAFWFEASNEWLLAEDLLALPPATTGTWDDDVFVAPSGDHVFFGLTGFDEVQYLGADSLVNDFVFQLNPDNGIVKVSHETFGEQQLHDIEAVWFEASNEWHLVQDLLSQVTHGTDGDDVFIAEAGQHLIYGNDGFDEIQFYGTSATEENFTFNQLADGGVRMIGQNSVHTLHDVEAVYFDFSGQWYLLENLV